MILIEIYAILQHPRAWVVETSKDWSGSVQSKKTRCDTL